MIDDGLSGLLGVDEVGLLQHSEMRRHGRFGDVEPVTEIARAHRPVLQQLQHAPTGGVGEGLENLTHGETFS